MSCNKIAEAFIQLQLLDISEDQIELVTSSEFTDEPIFTLHFSASSNRQLNEVIAEIRKLKSSTSNESIWSTLTESGISQANVQVWTYFVLYNGLLASASFDEKYRCILAAQLYFLLLTQPGSSGSLFFHLILFEKSTTAIKMAAKADTESNSGKKKKNASGASHTQRIPMSQTDVSSLEQREETVLTTDQIVRIISCLPSLLNDICHFLESYSLKEKHSSLVQLLEALVETLKQHGQTALMTHLHSNHITALSTPGHVTSKALQLIVNKKHGSIEQLALLVFRLLMTTITMRAGVSKSTSSTVQKVFIQRAEAALGVISAICKQHGECVHDAAKTLMQNIIAQSPDRTDFRQHTGLFVANFIYKMPVPWYADFVSWVAKLAGDTKIGHRVGAIGLIGHLLSLTERRPISGEEISTELSQCLTHTFLLKVVIDNIKDVSPTVRSKSLVVFAEVMEKKLVSETDFCSLFRNRMTESNRENDGVSSTHVSLFTIDETSSVDIFASILCERSSERKLTVRRSGLLASKSAICSKTVPPTPKLLAAIGNGCRDLMLSVRKSALQCATDVLNVHPGVQEVREMWVEGVFPRVDDNETSVQEKTFLLMEEKILQGVISQNVQDQSLSWDLLAFLSTEKGNRLRIYLQKAIRHWNRQQKVTKTLVQKIVYNLNNDDRKVPAWMTLRMMTLYHSDPITAKHVIENWKQNVHDDQTLLSLQVDMVCSVGQVAKDLIAEEKQTVIDILIKSIETHKCPIHLINHTCEAIDKFFLAIHQDKGDAEKSMGNWCKKMLEESDNWMRDGVITSENYDKELLMSHLFIVGDLAQRRPALVPKTLLLSIQALLTKPSDTEQSGHSQTLSQFHSGEIPSSIRAHAIFNLGRICYRNQQLAKKCVPAIARELEICSDESVRNNVLTVLTDLCVIETQLVDPYLCDMATCLGDESALIRKHSIILISSLLRREFIKWKGTLLFKFIHVACEPALEVRTLARYCLLEQLLRGQSAGDLFFRNFVACLFYFNNYNGHSVHKFMKSEREKRLFNLSGERGTSRRMDIYKFLLENMMDEHRINLTMKLCEDVLGAVVDKVIPLNKDTENILTDSLAVLCCKEIRLKCLKTKDDADDEAIMSTQEQGAALKDAINQKIISQVLKENLVQNIIPIIIDLKNMLAELQSPLVKNVMLYLKEVMQEYRSEVQAILGSDKQLASEIEFDLKRFEREEQEREEEQIRRRNAENFATPRTPSSAQQTVNRSIPPRTPLSRTPRAPFSPLAGAKGTPASVAKMKRPINIEAVLRSARKNSENIAPAITPAHEQVASDVVTSVPLRQQPSQDPVLTSPNRTAIPLILTSPENCPPVETRAASTPACGRNGDITFLAKDISVIVSPTAGKQKKKKKRLLLLPHPEQSPLPLPWNVTSPSPRRHPRQ